MAQFFPQTITPEPGRCCPVRGLVLLSLAFVLPFLCVTNAAAQAQVVRREYAIKAGVIDVLGRCVTWPAGAAPADGKPLVIGILGKDPFVENGINQLDRIVADEKLHGGNLVIKRFDSAKDYEPCHILFVSNLAADGSVEKTVLERAKAAKTISDGGAVLVVGEAADLLREGIVANLRFDKNTNLIRLELNPDAAARMGLKLAPDLLRLNLVQIVRDAPH